MAELSLGRLRGLAQVQGVKVYGCDGMWVSEIWDDNTNNASEAMLPPSVKSEHDALVSVLERYA